MEVIGGHETESEIESPHYGPTNEFFRTVFLVLSLSPKTIGKRREKLPLKCDLCPSITVGYDGAIAITDAPTALVWWVLVSWVCAKADSGWPDLKIPSPRTQKSVRF